MQLLCTVRAGIEWLCVQWRVCAYGLVVGCCQLPHDLQTHTLDLQPPIRPTLVQVVLLSCRWVGW